MEDLYEIGVKLILDETIIGQFEGLIKTVDLLGEAIDRVNTALGLMGKPVSDLAAASAGMATSWNAAADAAERMASAADRIHTPGGGDGGGAGGDDGRPGSPHNNGGGNGWDAIIFGGIGFGAAKDFVTGGYEQAATIDTISYQIQSLNKNATGGDIQEAIAALQHLQQQYPGLSQADALTIIKDSYQQSRSMPEAISMADSLAQSAYVLQTAGMTDAAGGMFSLLRSGELRALLNEKNPDGSVNTGPLQGFVANYTMAAESLGARFTPEMASQLASNLGGEGIMMSDQGLLETDILSMGLGASKTGVGINALAQQFVGGKMSQGAAMRLHEAGLLPDSMFGHDGKILDKYKNGIGNVLLPPGAVKDQADFVANPIDWLKNTYEPAVSKMAPGDQTALLGEILGSISQKTGARAAVEALLQDPYILRQEGFVPNVPTPAQGAANAANNPANVASGFGQAFDAFMAQLGNDAMPAATAQLRGLTAALNGLTDWAKHHPGAGSDLVTGGEVAGAGMLGWTVAGAWQVISKMIGGGAGAVPMVGESAAGEGAAVAAGAAGGFIAPVAAGLLGEAFMISTYNQWLRDHPDYQRPEGGKFGTNPGAPMPVYFVASPNGGPVPVAVTNPGAITGAVVSNIARHQGQMPTGQTGVNNALVPYSPGQDAPGAFHP